MVPFMSNEDHRQVLQRYLQRIEEIRTEMVGQPRPDILEALCDAALDVGPCVPYEMYETWAREISDGRDLPSRREDEWHVA